MADSGQLHYKCVLFAAAVTAITNRISVGGNAVASIHSSISPSGRPFVRPFVSTLSSELVDLWPWTFTCE